MDRKLFGLPKPNIVTIQGQPDILRIVPRDADGPDFTVCAYNGEPAVLVSQDRDCYRVRELTVGEFCQLEELQR